MKPCLFLTFSGENHYTYWLRESLKVNDFNVELRQVGQHENFAFIELDGRRVGIDWDDSTFWLSPKVGECDLYFKANLSSEIIAGENLPGHEPALFDEFRNTYIRWQSRIRPFILGRPFTGGIVNPLRPQAKTVLLASQSNRTGADRPFGRHREKIYEVLRDVLGDAFAFAYPGYNAEPLMESMKDYYLYLQFLSRGYFMLNLVGWLGSNPFRCIDACLASTCVVTDHIYCDAYKSFPAVHLPCNCYTGAIDMPGIFAVLENLIKNGPALYGELLHRQEQWFRQNLDLTVHCHQLLKS